MATVSGPYLGNVLTVVTDNVSMSTIDTIRATVASASDYYPFGLQMPGRTVSDTVGYRYGFNGKERDPASEWGQTHYDYGFRIYNPEVGKFLSVDPLTKDYPWYTPYQFAGNTPIQAIDLDGLEAFYVHGTWADPSFFSSTTLKIQLPKIFNNSKAIEFDWSPAENDVFTRLNAGFNLAMKIRSERIVGEPITIMAHSHGGNVAKIAINILTQQFNVNPSDINLITLNMPSRSDYEINDDSQFGVFHVNISSRIDLVQFSGGTDNVFEGGENKFSFGGNLDERADYNIYYDDQIELLDESGCGLSGHCGLAEDNVKIWIPELKNVVNEVDKQRNSVKKLQNSNSKMLHINE